MSEREFNYDEIPPGYYDAVASDGKGVRRYWHEYKFDFVIDAIAPLTKNTFDPVHVVDLGCGPGTFLGKLVKKLDVTGFGIDIAKFQIEYAQKKYGSDKLRFSCVDLEDETVRQEVNHADVVTIIEVIEHLHLGDVTNTLTYVHRNMKPGATLLVTTPNYVSYWPALEQVVNYLSEVSYEEQHITKFNRVKLKNLLIEIGFKDVKVRSFLHASPFAAGFVGDRIAQLFKNIEDRMLTHAGPLLCAQATK